MKLIRVGATVLNQLPLDWDGNQRRIADNAIDSSCDLHLTFLQSLQNPGGRDRGNCRIRDLLLDLHVRQGGPGFIRIGCGEGRLSPTVNAAMAGITSTTAGSKTGESAI